jgi:vesicle-fusing ATPase
MTAINFVDYGIGGLDESIQMALSGFLAPFLSADPSISRSRGLLLFGRAGCGKALIARSFAKILKTQDPIIVNGSEIQSRIAGNGESAGVEILQQMFSEAELAWKTLKHTSKPYVLIFDEIDILFPSGERDASSGFLNTFLSKIDGVDTLQNVIVIGVTTNPKAIDAQILRPGRFEVQIGIPLPKAENRREILDIYLKKLSDVGHLYEDVLARIPDLAWKTEFFSGSEIAALIHEASRNALERHPRERNLTDTSNPADPHTLDHLKVHWSDIEKALSSIDPAGRW